MTDRHILALSPRFSAYKFQQFVRTDLQFGLNPKGENKVGTAANSSLLIRPYKVRLDVSFGSKQDQAGIFASREMILKPFSIIALACRKVMEKILFLLANPVL